MKYTKRWTFFVPMMGIIISFSSCAAFFQKKIPMDTSFSKARLSDIVVQEKKIEKLDAPAQIFASYNLYGNRIEISWNPVAGASSYRLERALATKKNSDGSFKVPSESSFTIVEKFIYEKTSYSDIIIDDLLRTQWNCDEFSKVFFYRVCAENQIEKYESSTFIVSAQAKLFSPPSSIAASCGEEFNSIRVSWNKVEGASSYLIYRSSFLDGSSASFVGSITSNQTWYDDPILPSQQGDEFYYKVKAVSEDGAESVFSPIAYGYTAVEGAPLQVKNVAVDLTDGKSRSTNNISLSWDAVSGIGVHYTVYRSSSIDSSKTIVADNTTVTSCTDKRKKYPNAYYTYYVQSWVIDEDTQVKLKAPLSNFEDDEGKYKASGFIISPPSFISVEKEEEGNSFVTFSAPIGSKNFATKQSATEPAIPYSYRIYTSDTKDGSYSCVKTIDDAQLTAENGMYRVELSSIYNFYKISTVSLDPDEIESEHSILTAPSPYAAKNVLATEAAFIEGYNANASYVFPVKITWQEPEGGADGGYDVYRSLTKDKGYRKITTDPILNAREFIDENASSKVGTKYYYKVLSLNSLNQGTNFSTPHVGYGALTAECFMVEIAKTIKSSQKKLTLMHKGGTSALGTESCSGSISGSLSYNAQTAGLGGRVIMTYSNYADFYIDDTREKGVYMVLDGNTNTSANMSSNGTMDGTVQVGGMYTGSTTLDHIKVISGAGGGGYYIIKRNGFKDKNVSYTFGS